MTVKLIVVPLSRASANRKPPGLKFDETTFAAAVAAAATFIEPPPPDDPEDPPDDPEDPPDGGVTVGIFGVDPPPTLGAVGIVTFGAVPVGIVGIFGKTGIELYLLISQFTTAIAPSTAAVIAPMIPPMTLMTVPAIEPTILRAAPKVVESTGAT